jgi:hypothetical protein
MARYYARHHSSLQSRYSLASILPLTLSHLNKLGDESENGSGQLKPLNTLYHGKKRGVAMSEVF